MIEPELVQVLVQVPILAVVLGFIWKMYGRIDATLRDIIKTHDNAEIRSIATLTEINRSIKFLIMANLSNLSDTSDMKQYILAGMQEDLIRKEIPVQK